MNIQEFLDKHMAKYNGNAVTFCQDLEELQHPRTIVDTEKSCESCVHFVLRDFGFAGCDNGGICQHKDRFQPKDTRL